MIQEWEIQWSQINWPKRILVAIYLSYLSKKQSAGDEAFTVTKKKAGTENMSVLFSRQIKSETFF